MVHTARGRLRIYLGAAPGVGKTYAMLAEAHRRIERGADVAVGFVETHGRARTAELLTGLETVPRRTMTHRGAEFTELDLDAVLARDPAVALVDELAHTNVPGARNAKRWQDVEELLAAGIDVVSTVNIQHLESLGDVVEGITGVRQRETVPDEVVRRADQIELVDMSPQALRRRLAHGNVYAPEKVDAALAHYFRPGNLTALRELALLWTADRVDEYLQRYRAEQGIQGTWQARERIVVGLTGGPEGATLVRRAARIAARNSAGELLAVHISRSDGLSGSSPQALIEQRALVESLGGSFHTVLGDDPAAGLLDFARGVNATQIVIGTSRRKVWQYVYGPGVGYTVTRDSGDIDVHMVNHEHAARGRGRIPIRRVTDLGRTRTVAGWVIGVAGPPLLALLLTRLGGPGLSTDMLLFLALTVCAALVGGLFPAIASALVSSSALNYYFAPPIHTFTIAQPENIVAVAIFAAVGIAVATVVDVAARRSHVAARAQAEAQTLSALAGTVLRGAPTGEGVLTALLEQVRETFQQEAVALLERTDAHGPWQAAAAVGPRPPAGPEQADADVPVGERLALVLRGRVLPAADRRMLGAFANQAAVLLERRRLAGEAAAARREAEGNRIRTALLAAVSHDLRTPLAGIKAAVSSLRAEDVEWDEEDEAELLAGIESGADRLDHLINNLLDMSRLQTGTVTPLLRPTDLDEVVPFALGGVPPGSVRLDVPESLPMVRADAGLLERVLANLVENAVKYGPPGSPVLVKADLLERSGRVELRVVDRGPGVPEEARERIFAPFQRYGDAPRGAGVGLGLAVARGFAEAMGGAVTAEDTPGGGLTMVVALPAAPSGPHPDERTERTERTEHAERAEQGGRTERDERKAGPA
ncbi:MULTISPECIES: sensor histidine kinase KdpD [Kitasatospora]|uniref:histidine kinase n=1 Tax=Kitasatospora setae (strain ATCC 33774 / DSM 43861 / JCM 3304 / KCC A-0304 / NBRC 14216 / KM-6054) TaxID=452652 RepID=E4NB97_KITSK|nr:MULTISPECIES: sensor histidine kinase KdpD [Kitasatospora]BAJ28478.1 putative two-component system sensor kinase [Kitasatospora setae KM-6054]